MAADASVAEKRLPEAITRSMVAVLISSHPA